MGQDIGKMWTCLTIDKFPLYLYFNRKIDMKKLIEDNGITYLNYEYEGYNARFIVVDDKITDLVLTKPNGDEVVSAPIYNNKYPNGLPMTPYYKRQLKAEIVDIVNEMLDIKDVIMSGDETIIDEILEEM